MWRLLKVVFLIHTILHHIHMYNIHYRKNIVESWKQSTYTRLKFEFITEKGRFFSFLYFVGYKKGLKIDFSSFSCHLRFTFFLFKFLQSAFGRLKMMIDHCERHRILYFWSNWAIRETFDPFYFALVCCNKNLIFKNEYRFREMYKIDWNIIHINPLRHKKQAEDRREMKTIKMSDNLRV